MGSFDVWATIFSSEDKKSELLQKYILFLGHHKNMFVWLLDAKSGGIKGSKIWRGDFFLSFEGRVKFWSKNVIIFRSLCTESKKIGCFLSVWQSYIIFWVGFDYLFEARFKFRCFLFSVYHDNWWFLTASSDAQGPRNSFSSGGGWVSLIFLT